MQTAARPQPAPLTRVFSEPAQMVLHLTGLVVLVDFLFNSLVVGVPCSLIFWCFLLFIDFRLVVILLLVVWKAKGFYLCLHFGQNSPCLFYLLSYLCAPSLIVPKFSTCIYFHAYWYHTLFFCLLGLEDLFLLLLKIFNTKCPVLHLWIIACPLLVYRVNTQCFRPAFSPMGF